MPVPASKASELYKKLIEDGYTADNIGSEEEFSKKASTKEGAGKLHSVLLSEGYTEDNLGNIDEFTTKLVSVSPDKKKVSTTEQPASSEGLQDGGLESTTSTTETVPVQKKGKPAQIIVGELQTAASPEEQYKKEEGKILPPRGHIGFKDGYVIDKSITEEFEDFPEVAEKLEIKRESGEVEKPYSREALLKLRGTDYGAYKSKLNNVKTYFDIREDLGTGKANEFSRLIFETTGKGNVYDEVNNFIYSASKQKQIIDESLSGSKKDKAIDRLYENENNWVERSFTPELSKKYISEKLKKEYNIDDISSLSLEDVKQKMGDGIVNQGIFNKYKNQYFPETFEEGATADSKDAGNRTGFIFNGLLSGIGKYSAGAADLTMQLLTNILPDEAVGGTGTPEENREAALRQFREEAIPTIRTATEELYGAKISDSKREQFEKEFFTSAFRGVTESIPMMMGFKGSGLLLGGYDAGMQTINSTKSGQGLSEGTKTIFAASVGTASALLEKLGIDKIFGKQSKKVATNLAIKTMAELVEKSSVPITTEIFEKALMANVSSLKNKLIKSGGKIAEAGVVEFATGSAQEAANILGEEILNKVEKKQVFDPLDWGQTFSRIAYAGAQEAIGGGVFGAISIPFSKTRNYISEKVNNAKTPEDINKLKDEIVQFGQKQNINEDQLNAALSLVDQYSAVYSKIPADVKNRTKVAEQILERDELNEKAATTLQEAQDLDPAFQEQKVEEAKILTNKANEIQNKISGKPVYKIGDQTVDRDTFNNYLDSEAANKQDVELYVENDNEVSSKLEQMGGVTTIDNDTDVPFTTNKIEKYDTKNITGIPSEVRVGEELIQAEPVEVGGTQEISGGGILQENVPSGEGKVAEVTQGEVKPIKINEFAKNLNESAGTLKTPDGKKASNYVSKEGVEVTLTEDEDGGYVNGNQVQGDIMLDFIGNDTKRGEGLASKELDKIIAEADKNNMSISLVVDSEQAIRGTESKKGLSNKELKKWYESKGFIFDRDSRFGYRPKATEDVSIYKKPEYIAKKGEVKIDDIETHSSPQDLQEAFDQDRLKEGTFHEDGDNYIYKVEDGKLKEVKNVKYIGEYEKGMYKPRLEYTELPVPSKKTQGEVKIKKSEKELGIEKEEPIFVEQKTEDEQTVRPESRGERTGREGVRTITPLEGAPSVPGINGADPQLVAVAEEYARQNGIPLKRQAEYAKVDENRAKRIADEYEKMKHDPQNPRVKEAYQNLIKQTIAQYKALVDAGYKFWFIDANIPSNAEYASSPYNALRDARQNKTMGVFPTTDGFGTNESIDVSDNPLMAETGFYWSVGGLDGQKKPVLANDLFRAVHDMFGHGLEGAGFRARGEENAWQAHVRLFTGSAIGAITSETRGQNSWLNYGKYGEQNRNAKVEDTIFADQKTGLMPEWTWTEGRVGDMEEAKTKPQQIGEGLLSHLGIPTEEKETKFSKTTGEPEALTPKEDKEKEIVSQMNSMDLVNKGIDLSSPSTIKEKIDVNELNSRLDNPLDSIKWEDYEGIPFTFTISDQLRTGDIKNPNTGEVITNLKGGIGFNGTEGNENNAWANTTKEEAEAMLQRAKDVYQNNKPLFDKLWKEGKLPDGHIPMAVVKMAETSILSNEAVFRTGIENIETLPKANRKKAVSELAKSMKAKIDTETKSLKRGVDKNGKPYTKNTIKLKKKSIVQYQKILDSIKENKYDDIVNVLKDKDDFSLPEKAIIANEIFYGSPTPIGGKEIDITKSRPNTPVSKALIGNKNPALINLGKITDLLTEPSMKNVPNMHIVSIVGVDVKNPKVNEISHTNYPYGVKGKSIGILESPVHMKDAFGEAYGSTLSQIVKNEADNASISVKNALTQGIPVQSGLPNRVFKSAIAKGRLDAVDKLSGFLRQAFPNTTFFTSKEAWDAAMADPSIKKKLKDGDVVYAFTTDGNVFINPELKTTKATLHETGHIWIGFVKENNPELHQRGLDLVSGTKEHQKAIDEYGDTELAREEALMELMSSKGETILNAAQKARFKEWLLTVYKYISDNFKSLMGLSPKEIENLTLDKFLEGMLSDILSGKELTTKKLKSEAKFSLESQNARIKDYIESQRKAGETDADIRAGIESVADKIGLSKEDINALMKGEVKAEVPVQENPFENIPKTQVARDKYFDTTFGENADKAREIYNQGGTPAEMLAKMQEAGLEPPVPPTKEKVTLSAEPEKVGIRKEDIKELAIKYDLEIAERRETISDAELETMAKQLIANGYDVNKLVQECLAPEKRPLTDIEANILAEVAADMKAKIDSKSSNADIAKYRDVLSALNRGISENARGLRMAKVKKNVVESIADVMADMMDDTMTDELTAEQRKIAEERFNDIKVALDKETELRKQAEQEIDRLKAELEVKKQKDRAENKPKKNKQDYASERKAIIQSIKDKWNKASKGEGGLTMAVVPYQSQLMAIAPDVARLVKSYLEQGAATTLEEVRALLKKDIQDAGVDVQDEDVRGLIAGNYTKKKPTKNQYAKKLYELKQEEKLLLQIEALERGEEPTTEKKRIEKNQKLADLRKKIKELTGKEVPKREKKEKTEKTEDEKFEQAVNARIKANQKKQSEIQDKINRGDFSPEVKKLSILENTELQNNNKALYDEYLKSVLNKDEALLDYEKARVADQMKNRTKLEKISDGVDVLIQTSKGTVAMADQSFTLVQMLPFAFSHPIEMVKFAARAAKNFASKTSFDKSMAILHSTALWDVIEKSGLAIYEPRSAKSEMRNELHGGDKNLWNKEINVGGKKISVGQAFERSATTALNNARLYLFMNSVQDLYNAGKTFENSPESFKAAARIANEFTGHGKVHEMFQNKNWDKIIWSKKMFSSTFNLLGLGDLIRPVATANAIGRRLGITTKETSKYSKGFYTSLTADQAKFATKELTRFVVGGMMIMIATKLSSIMAGDDDDEVVINMNPKSTDFGNMIVGGKKISIYGRFGSAVRTVCQVILGERTTAEGENKALGDGYGNKTSGEVMFGSFVRGKMTPSAGIAYDFILNNKKNYYTKEELSAKEIAKQLTIPLAAREVFTDIDRDGALVGTIETIAKIYGATIRDERDFIKKEKPTFTELEMKDEGDKRAFDFLKKYEVPVPTFLNKERYRLEVDAKHPEAGKTKDGKPYALYSDEEFKMYNDFKKDYIIKALKILNRLDKSGTVKLTKEVIEDKLKSVEIQASKVAKNKLIAKGKISRKNKEESDTDITIGEEFSELFSAENPEE